MSTKEKQLVSRLDSIIGKTFDLLALRNSEEVAENLLELFGKATSIKAKLHEEANRHDKLKELEQAEKMSLECNKDFEEAIVEKEKKLLKSNKLNENIVNLVSVMYEVLAELKGIQSLIATQKLLKEQIAQLEDHLRILTENFQQNWKVISSSTFETSLNEELQQAKQILVDKVAKKEQELEAINNEEPRVAGQYQSLRERYIELLEKQNLRKFKQIQNYQTQTRATSIASRTPSNSEIRETVQKRPIEVRSVKRKSSNQIESGIAVVLFLVTLCLMGGYFYQK